VICSEHHYDLGFDGKDLSTAIMAFLTGMTLWVITTPLMATIDLMDWK
jgi:hypothetical protein